MVKVNKAAHLPDPRALQRGADEKVADVGSKLGFLANMAIKFGPGVANKVMGSSLHKKELDAIETLQKQVQGLDVITRALPKELSVVIQFLQERRIHLDQGKEEGKGKQLLQSCTWIALGNIAKKVIKENERISLDEFSCRALKYLVPFIGDRLNQIDAQIEAGKACNGLTFQPLIDDLFDDLLELKVGKLTQFGLDILKNQIAEQIATQYQATKTMIQTGVSEPGINKATILPLMKKVGTYLTTVFTKQTLEEDKARIGEITGHGAETVHQLVAPLIERMTPLVASFCEDTMKDYLAADAELQDQLTTTLVHKMLSNAVEQFQKAHPGEQVKLEHIVEDVQKRCTEALKGNAQDVRQLADYLVRSLILNDVPFLAGYYERYQDAALDQVGSFLNPLFDLVRNEGTIIADAQKALEKKVQMNPATIGAVEHLIEQVATRASAFALPYDPEENLFAAPTKANAAIKGPIASVMKSFMWKILVRFVPNPPEGKVFQADELFPRVLDHFVQFANVHFPHLMEEVKRDWKDLPVEERQKRALILTKPMLDAFIKEFISDDLEAEIPLPVKFRKTAVEKIEEALNGLVADGLVASCSWMLEQKDNEEAINKLFRPHDANPDQPSAPVKACHAAGKIIEVALPYQCRKKGDGWAQLVADSLEEKLPKGEPSQKIAAASKNLLSSFFNYVGAANQSPEMKSLLSFVGNYSETTLLKLTRQLGERVEKLDNALVEGDASTMEKIMGLLTKELEPHLRVYGENQKLFRKNDRKKIFEVFKKEGLLHPGMEDAADRDVIFKTWSVKFLALAGMSSSAYLPVPDLFKKEAWKKVQDTVLPSMLEVAFDKLKDPHMLDQVISMGLEKVSADWNKAKTQKDKIRDAFFPKSTKDFKPEAPKVRQFEDPFQLEMEDKFGQVGRSLLKLHSNVLIKAFLRMKWVQKKLGEVVGQPLRGNLRKGTDDPLKPGKEVTLNEVLNATMEAFVDHFAPCEKVGDQWNYFGHDEKGAVTAQKIAEPDFSELFPKTDKDEKLVHAKDVIRRAILQRQVVKGTSQVIKDQLNLMIQTAFNLFWDAMVNGHIRLFRAMSRTKHKDRVELGVRKYFWFWRRYVIFPALALLTIVLRKIVSAILTKKGNDHLNGLKREIHVNLAYRFVDELLHKLETDVRREAEKEKKA